jgi:hypothetical protein
LTFEQWLRTLESNPRLLAIEAKTRRNLLRYKSALRHWKEACFPSPTEPPEQWRRQVSAYTEKWMLEWSDSGKQDFLPLNPKKLISLWKMIEFPIELLIECLEDLEWYIDSIQDRPPQTKEKIEKKAQLLIKFVRKMLLQADKLELIETTGCCERFIRALEDSVSEVPLLSGSTMRLDTFTPPELVRELKGIRDAVEKELRQRKFAFIPTGKDKFFEQEKLFGEAVHTAFPSAASEIKDAGNCLAADLNTAAIFHLMRAVEAAMRVLVVHLEIKLKNKALKETGWDELIKLIDKKLKERREKYDNSKRKKRSEWSDLKFYGVIADELNVFKENWRDKVMHTWDAYNELEAMNVFVRVRGFMQKLATKVTENN